MVITKQQKRVFKELGLSDICVNEKHDLVSARIKFSKPITPAVISSLVKIERQTGLNTPLCKHVHSVLERGVLFDFGNIDEDVLYKEAMRGRKLYTEGILDLPFENCMFRFKSHASQVGESVEVFSLIHKSEKGMIATAYMKTTINHELVVMPVGTFELWDNKYHTVPEVQGRQKLEGEMLHPDPILYDSDLLKEQMGIAYKSIFCPLLILNTRYVPSKTKTVPRVFNSIDRANKAVNTTVFVDGKIYAELAKVKKTHNKRIPHLRRGHVRTLKSGKQIWIRDCLVNFTTNQDINQLYSNQRSYKVIHDQYAETIQDNDLIKQKKPNWMKWLGFTKTQQSC